MTSDFFMNSRKFRPMRRKVLLLTIRKRQVKYLTRESCLPKDKSDVQKNELTGVYVHQVQLRPQETNKTVS